ncbi:hypothetical protein E4T38_04235 [Aureobasidium subglaciale]|nr:hypothetical protein E4T38_04235 [Aureobasidium subglaciale]KAI5224554.1 hypothetical protein E4T40_03953 [Aureobasidium subglaciale]KAI5227775.1 hypothetical protein E4T41_04173 [Aureobasidium subglaciale]KAI5263245.1 hypothetical protein E4T46_03794 [Aureobasidium subglaciale]
MESRASSAMNDAGSRSPTGPPGISTIKAERTADGTPHEIMSASQTPAPNTADQPTESGSRQSSSRPADLSSAQDFPDVAMGDAMPYGTRSRNRAGNPRPNYAEDQDMDFEVPPPPAKPASAKNVTANQQDAIDPRTTIVEPSFARVNGTDHDERSPSASGKETIPGTSAFSTVPPKKRKAAGVANTAIVASGSGNTTTNAVAQPTTKRPASSMPLANMSPESNMMTFEKSKGVLRKGGLVSDDGQILYVNGQSIRPVRSLQMADSSCLDHVYLVCEPPGDPYYLCRIMEFLHSKSDDPKSPVDSIRVNWFYRPRDVQRLSSDSRLVYGTMHSDVCPLTSLRGKCKILHRSEIGNLDEYRKESNCFWFSQIFDRFIRRFYEVIPTSQIINVPDKVKRALDERWKFIAVEVNRVKELTAAVKLCKRCTQYCASNDSVDCAICGTCYHMNCVRPPLPKKPTRGFAWACGPCGRAAEKKLEARNTPLGGVDEEEEIIEEEEEDPALAASTRAPSPSGPDVATDQHPGTQAEIAMAKMWPFRYLGIHCRVEDALQYDDRAIYPRASSRLGPRHQANVNVWHGRPVDLRKPADIKKRFVKGGGQKKDTKLTKETLAAIEADRKEREKRPKWVQDEPPGYVHRGEDFDNDDPNNTARLIFKMPNDDDEHAPASSELFIDKYMDRVKAAAKSLKVTPCSANYLDKALELLIQSKYNPDKAIEQLSKVDRIKDLKEPILTADELKKFEEGVMKYGSEHRSVRLHMKTHRPTSTIIRFYYLWKKTPRGRQIWDNYGGRKGRKRQNMDAASKLQAEVAHDLDDSAFDTDKAKDQKRGFQCKHCSTRHSRQWRRAPGISPGQTVPSGEGKTAKDKSNRLLLALCGRCAGLWRRYAIVWEDIDEATKKAVQAGGRAWKRKLDEEVVREILASNEAAPADANVIVQSVEGAEPPKKKAKLGLDGAEKKKAPKLPTPPPPPIVPEEPRWRDLECFVCNVLDSAGERPIVCSHCKLSVHKRCYGLSTQVVPAKWVCDQCTNDRTPAVSTEYLCTLCPIEETAHEMLEPPRVTHKKKSDREREKERLEKELMDSVQLDYSKKQANLNRPINPREPLKRTDGNNWVHVQCAIWTPEIRFSDASLLERAEGLSAIPMERYEAVCKVCKKNNHGACVSCLHCRANFHVGCAVQAGYTLGFDVTPVKGSRKDQVITATLGEETGALTAAIWCKEHAIKTAVHPISEAIDDKTQNALQVFVENYKQADPTLTGTARKANLLSQSTKLASQATLASATANRRISTASGLARSARNSPAGFPRNDEADGTSSTEEELAKTCLKCHTDTSPRWWTAEETLKKLQAQTPVTTRNEDSLKGYRCNKCHFKRINSPQEASPPPAPARKRVSLSPPKQFPLQIGWGIGIANQPPQPLVQTPVHTPGSGPVQATLPVAVDTVGQMQPPAPQTYPGQYQTSHAQVNGYTPGSMPTYGHSTSSTFAQANGQVSNQHHHVAMSNGIHGVHHQHPQTLAPITNGQQTPGANAGHGSPPTGLARAATPRDGSVDIRTNGASASPSLRNLLHYPRRPMPRRRTRSGVGTESRGRAERGESRAEPMLSVTLYGIGSDRDIGIAVIRMGKAYPEEARSQVRQLLQQGVAEDEIEKQTGVSDRTIRRWKVMRLRYGRIGKPPESRTGRHRVMNKDVEQALFDRVAQKPDMSVDDMLWWLYDTYKLVVGTRTIRRAFERRNTSHKKFRTHARKHFSIDMGVDMDLDSDVDVDVHVDTQSHDHHAPMQNLVQETVSMPATQAHMTVSQPDTTYQSPYALLMAMADATDDSNQPPPPDISPELARALGGLTESTHMHQDLMPDHMDPLSEDEETLQLQLQQIMLQKKEVELKLKMRRLRQRRESHTPNDDSLFDHLDVDTTSNSHMLPDSTANNDPFAPQSVTTDTNPNTPKPRDSRSKSKVQEARKRTEERQERMLKDLERRSRRREHLTAEWVQSRDVWAKGPEKLLVQLMHKHSTYAYNQNSLETFEAIFAELYHLVDHTEWYAPVHDDLLRERTRRKMSQLRSKMVKSGEIISRGEGYGGWTKPDDHDALAGATDLSGTAPEDTSLDISQHHHQIDGLSMDLHAHDSNHDSLMARDAMMQHDHSMLEHLQGNSADLHHGDFDHDQLARHQNELLAQRGIAHEAQLSHQIEETMAAGLASV